MAIKKALVGLGVVCVVAPAALAAMSRGGDYDGFGRKAADALSGLGLMNLLGVAQQEQQETPLAAGRRNSDLGSRVSGVLVQQAGLDLSLEKDGSLSEDAPVLAAIGGVSDIAPVNSERQTSPRVAAGGQPGGGPSGTGASQNRNGGGATAAGRGGGASGAGGSGGGDGPPQRAANDAGVPTGSPRAEPGGVLAAVPIPASVWMLLASIATFSVGARFRSRSL